MSFFWTGILVLAGFLGGMVVELYFVTGLGTNNLLPLLRVAATLGGEGVMDLEELEFVPMLEEDSSCLLKAMILDLTLEEDGFWSSPSSMDPLGEALDEELGLLALLLVALSLLYPLSWLTVVGDDPDGFFWSLGELSSINP